MPSSAVCSRRHLAPDGGTRRSAMRGIGREMGLTAADCVYALVSTVPGWLCCRENLEQRWRSPHRHDP